MIEWYDFALFGFLAPVLSELFFPADDLLAGLIKTYGIFAAGYVMRPIGGVLFGHVGDRIGRRRTPALSGEPLCPLFCLYRTWPRVHHGPLKFLSARGLPSS